MLMIAGISVLEVITVVVDGLPSGYRWLNIVSNYLGFGLSPAVSICLVYVLDRKTALRRKIRIAVCCEIAYLMFLLISIPYGMVFSVSVDNIYSRGPHFYIYVIMYFGAILYLSISTIITAREFQNRSRMLIYPLILFVMAETVIQVALPELHVTWLCVTLLSVLYFIYCNEMWNQLDALTGLLNQNSYLKQTREVKYNKGVLVVFDADDFNQPSVEINVCQGERPLARDNKSIGRFHLDGIPAAPRGVPQIEVTFDIDANGILNVSAKDKGTGKEQKIRIEASSGLTEQEIQRMRDEAKANEAKDKEEKERIDKINAADSNIFATEKQLKEYGDKLPADKKAAIETALGKLKEAHKNADVAAIDTALAELNAAWQAASQDIYAAQQQQGGAQQGAPHADAGAGTNGQQQGGSNQPEDVEFEEVK